MANIAAPIDFNFMTIVVILNLVVNTKITNKCHIGKTVVKYLRLSLMRKKNEIYAKSELSRQDLTFLKDVGLMVSNPHRGIDSPDSF